MQANTEVVLETIAMFCCRLLHKFWFCLKYSSYPYTLVLWKMQWKVQVRRSSALSDNFATLPPLLGAFDNVIKMTLHSNTQTAAVSVHTGIVIKNVRQNPSALTRGVPIAGAFDTYLCVPWLNRLNTYSDYSSNQTTQADPKCDFLCIEYEQVWWVIAQSTQPWTVLMISFFTGDLTSNNLS